MRKFSSRGKAVLLLAAAVASGFWSAFGPRVAASDRWAVLEHVSGQEVEVVARYSLAREGSFEVNRPWGRLVIQVRGGRIRIASANAPCDPREHDLFNPWISRKDELDVCLPHRALLRIIQPPAPGQ